MSQTATTIMKTSTTTIANPQYPILSNQVASIEDLLQTTLAAKWSMQSVSRLQSDGSSFQYQQALAFTESIPFKSKVYRSSHGTYTTYARKHIDETCRWSLGSSVDCHRSNRKSWLGIFKVATQGKQERFTHGEIGNIPARSRNARYCITVTTMTDVTTKFDKFPNGFAFPATVDCFDYSINGGTKGSF
ncbi:hypothetical protein MMC29_006396, partial [Sticta canariensis]|nr:hypothetical protein [Sticta canariensis]